MPAEIIRPLGILAGEGALPRHLTRFCVENDIPVCAVQFKNCAYFDFPTVPILHTRIERVGEIFSFLKANNVKDVVMIGNLQKPSLSSMRPDLRGLRTLGKIAKSFVKGDDNLLRSLRREIEAEGFMVRGVDCYLTDLTAQAGCLTKTGHAQGNQFINSAIEMAIQHGVEDKGQSILAHSDGTYSFETREGTTALIEQFGREGSILVKMMKPQQDPDLDRPTVGLETIRALVKAQCDGMIIHADAVFMIDKNDMIECANQNNIFIEAINP